MKKKKNKHHRALLWHSRSIFDLWRSPVFTPLPCFALISWPPLFVKSRSRVNQGRCLLSCKSPLPSAVFNKKLECAPSHLMLSNNTDLSTSPLLFRRSRVRRDPPASNHANIRLHPSLLAVPGHHVPSSSSASLTATLLHTPTASQSGLYIHDIKTDTVTRRLRNI